MNQSHFLELRGGSASSTARRMTVTEQGLAHSDMVTSRITHLVWMNIKQTAVRYFEISCQLLFEVPPPCAFNSGSTSDDKCPLAQFP